MVAVVVLKAARFPSSGGRRKSHTRGGARLSRGHLSRVPGGGGAGQARAQGRAQDSGSRRGERPGGCGHGAGEEGIRSSRAGRPCGGGVLEMGTARRPEVSSRAGGKAGGRWLICGERPEAAAVEEAGVGRGSPGGGREREKRRGEEKSGRKERKRRLWGREGGKRT